ncbi:MAG: hypothetical protein WDO24_07035 [Pseudomonadota bacterium]
MPKRSPIMLARVEAGFAAADHWNLHDAADLAQHRVGQRAHREGVETLAFGIQGMHRPLQAVHPEQEAEGDVVTG